MSKETEEMAEAMDVDPVEKSDGYEDRVDIEEDVTALLELVDDASAKKSTVEKIQLLQKVLEDKDHLGPKAITVKERAMYDLARTHCEAGSYEAIVPLLKETRFLEQITKAKMAKVVRSVLDIVCNLAPTELEMQAKICRSIIEWTQQEKRTFLRQRVEAKLTSILVDQKDFGPALTLVDRLLLELKKLDDKQLLVETHLMEAKIHFGLRNVPKAKAALTASRTAANAIYVSPQLQATIDSMSGTIHCEEGDYDTAHSYFLEAFEQLDQLNNREKAVQALKYMMLCRILDSLTRALKISAKGGVGVKSDRSDVDISGMISGRQGVKYAGKDIEAMSSIASAASRRSLKEFESVIDKFSHELQDDLLIKHHLYILKEQLLESNLIRIIEPYSCVEISHIASLMEMPLAAIEKKLSQMILDGKFQGILDQGKGQLIVYEESEKDYAMEKGLEVIDNMDAIVTTLFARSKALRTMMI
mmetsp:Transcript_32142/g.48521  ORF Transcript_32142/g.48521 Transcript_32142/m.48521 type:complete len:474 (-) Transcript_32142:57-1478(-)|eukprot:CAMPEP_0178930004 /NCGR_PEP_ID=MMETSP0786-20121207/20971_1 /TAXON_ID=186022 /ORGANISM="Thalassionema frauenfeldii, Strain CCMP 1798" /LENGTH=473 /DNA_ID=CAMNT_0020606437 /DNA_START=93 /DNA_END=1514 /DNA_ORIENTATION=-